MKTFKQFIDEAAKERVIGTLKKVPTAKVVVRKAKFGGMNRLTVFLDMGQGMGIQKLKTGFDPKMTDKEIADDIKNGSWASKFKTAGGVNWVK